MHRPTEFYLALGTLLFAAGTAAIVIAEPFAPPRVSEETGIPLKVMDQEGRLRVDWNPRTPVVQASDSATLEVIDGGVFHRYPVDKRILENGGLDYIRRSTDVTLTLTTYAGGRPSAQAVVRTIGAPEPAAGDDSAPQTRVEGR
jgi:hypothetical protein